MSQPYNAEDRARNIARAAYLARLAVPVPTTRNNAPARISTKIDQPSPTSSTSSSSTDSQPINATVRRVPIHQLSPRARAFLGPRQEYKYETPDSVGYNGPHRTYDTWQPTKPGTKVTIVPSAIVAPVKDITLPHFARREAGSVGSLSIPSSSLIVPRQTPLPSSQAPRLTASSSFSVSRSSAARPALPSASASYAAYKPASKPPVAKEPTLLEKLAATRGTEKAVAIPFQKAPAVKAIMISKSSVRSIKEAYHSQSAYSKTSLPTARVWHQGSASEGVIRRVQLAPLTRTLIESDDRPTSSKGVICRADSSSSIASSSTYQSGAKIASAAARRGEDYGVPITASSRTVKSNIIKPPQRVSRGLSSRYPGASIARPRVKPLSPITAAYNSRLQQDGISPISSCSFRTFSDGEVSPM